MKVYQEIKWTESKHIRSPAALQRQHEDQLFGLLHMTRIIRPHILQAGGVAESTGANGCEAYSEAISAHHDNQVD